MADHLDSRPEDFCPRCGCNTTEEYRKKKSRDLFELEYAEILKHPRARAKLCGRLIGVILGVTSYLVLLALFVDRESLVAVFSKKVEYNPLDYILPVIIVLFGIIFGVMGFFAGTHMLKSEEEKDLWKNFNPYDPFPD